MPFQLGDVLIKVDLRATAETTYTRHHVMLVLGESDKGYPIVAHMIAYPRWKLIKEELKRGKDLILIRYPWPKETQKVIAEATESALSSNKFIITREIIKEQNRAVSSFRPYSILDEQSKLALLQKAFLLEFEKNKDFVPNPPTNKVISCHEWVISMIHYACRQTKYPIPHLFQIPPHLAWADRIRAFSKYDKVAFCITVMISPDLDLSEEKPPPLELTNPLTTVFP